MNTFHTINPATGNVISEFRFDSAPRIEERIRNAQEAFTGWKNLKITDRAPLFNNLAALLETKKHSLAELMCLEMGKPVTAGIAEVEKCAWVCAFYAEKAEEFLSPTHIESDAKESFVCHQPLGVVLAIMPWNFPLWQLFRFAAPGLMAGNTALLKHASNVPECAMEIERLFAEAGFPSGVMSTLFMTGEQTENVIGHAGINAVTLTGSVGAGQKVGAAAGRSLKKVVLELGGSDPYLILDDADLNLAAQACVSSRLINSGQSCIAAKRFIVCRDAAEAFTERVVNLMRSAIMGDPRNSTTEIGPLAREDLRTELHQQVTRSIAAGSTCILGGKIPEQPGFFYAPTVLTGVQPGMPAYHEELFGPVAAIIPVENEEHAIKIANDTAFGLGAAVFTRDTERGRFIATNRLDAGCCFVNDFVRSDPRLPFGGIKDSGFGRELSRHGILEFVNAKTVSIH